MTKMIFIVLAVLYALNPYDIFPDFIIGWGWLDDLVILGLLGRYLYLQKKKRERFQQFDQARQQSHDSSYDNTRMHDNSSADSRNTSQTWDSYKVLGIERGASQDEIKQAYRHLANKYHPDKVAHLGDEFRELAEIRFKEIQQAYQELTRR
jgi:DnaJ-domain-containing protein 1